MAHKIIITRSTDNAGLYLNGTLVLEGRDLRVEDVLETLSIEFETVAVDPDWLRGREGRLPPRPAHPAEWTRP